MFAAELPFFNMVFRNRKIDLFFLEKVLEKKTGLCYNKNNVM